MSLGLLAVLGGCLVVALAFVRFEQAGRPQRTAGVVLLAILVELLLYPSQNDVGEGLFSPFILGFSLRLPELLIVLALGARLVVRGLPSRVTAMGAAWGAFFIWWAGALVTGLLHGNGVELALFQFKALIYVGGGMVLAAGVPVERVVDRRTLRRWMTGLGLVLVACVVPTITTTGLELDLPIARGAVAGVVAADAATVLVAIAAVTLLVEGARRQRRQLRVALPAVLMLVFPFLQGQRGALIGFAVAALLVIAVSMTATWKRRIATTNVEALLFLALALVPLVLNTMWSAMDSDRNPATPAVSVPLADDLSESFTSTGKQQSAKTRQNLWLDGLERFDQRPIIGSGLGTEYRVDQAAVREDLVGGGFHNILIDILVRTGWIGAALFAVACAVTVRTGRDLWRRHPDPRVAALALGAMVALANLAAKGMVESVFEKYRLATLTGLLLGVIVSAAASMPRSGGTDVRSWDDIDERQLEAEAG